MKRNRFNLETPPYIPDKPDDVFILGIDHGADTPEVLLCITRPVSLEHLREAIGAALQKVNGDAGPFAGDLERVRLRKVNRGEE